jgi:hypothetical protein
MNFSSFATFRKIYAGELQPDTVSGPCERETAIVASTPTIPFVHRLRRRKFCRLEA